MNSPFPWTDEQTAPFATAWRKATVLKVVDGDTLDLAIDLGFEVQIVTRIRLMAEGDLPTGGKPASVDAWETRGAERELGLKAKTRVLELLTCGTGIDPKLLASSAIGRTVRIYSAKAGSRGKYGRWLAVILYGDTAGVWRSLGDTLLAEGHADDPGY